MFTEFCFLAKFLFSAPLSYITEGVGGGVNPPYPLTLFRKLYCRWAQVPPHMFPRKVYMNIIGTSRICNTWSHLLFNINKLLPEAKL